MRWAQYPPPSSQSYARQKENKTRFAGHPKLATPKEQLELIGRPSVISVFGLEQMVFGILEGKAIYINDNQMNLNLLMLDGRGTLSRIVMYFFFEAVYDDQMLPFLLRFLYNLTTPGGASVCLRPLLLGVVHLGSGEVLLGVDHLVSQYGCQESSCVYGKIFM